MKQTLTLLTTLVLAAFTAHAVAPKGTLVIIGGGVTPSGMHRKLLDLAGGIDAQVLVVPFGKGPEADAAPSVASFNKAGATHVSVMSADDAKTALAQVQSAAVIWFSGGKQSLMMPLLQRLGVVDAIRERHAQGAVLAGSSAGAAIMSKVMLMGADKAKDGKIVPKFGEGLGVWPEVIVDQHFVKRGREPRLHAAIQAHPDLLGVGIDESTFVLVKGDSLEVGGKSTVLVLDARAGGEMKRNELKAGVKYQWAR